MNRTSGRVGVGLLLVSMLVGACLTERDNGDASMAVARPEAVAVDARGAQDVVFAVRSQLERAFGGANFQVPGERTARFRFDRFDAVGLESASEAEHVISTGLFSNAPKVRADVHLPERANDAFRLRDEVTGVSVEVGLVGASAAEREASNGYVVYRNAYANGAHIVQRPTAQGTEDYVFFPDSVPEKPELRYEIALGEKVAGLRIIDKTIEVVDAGGVPRLRMSPPYAVDGDGRRLSLNVAIEGCAYDTDPRMPWEHATVDPGSRHCMVQISWDATAKAPLVVDPEWKLTTSMAKVRMNATATLLPNGHVLVAGGDLGTSNTAMNSAEVYNPHMDIWTPTAQMARPRSDHQVIALGDYAIAMGGAEAALQVDKYTYQTNSWSEDANPVMIKARSKFTATLIPGKAIVAVGGLSTGGLPYNNAEYLSLTAGGAQWTYVSMPMSSPRFGHSATLIDTGKVLIAGGIGEMMIPVASTEVYLHGGMPGSWYPTGMMPNAHAFHSALRLSDGRVVVAGGVSTTMVMAPPTANVDIFDITANPVWKPAKPMTQGRSFFGAALVPGTDEFVAMGGKTTTDVNGVPSKKVEKYLPLLDKWIPLEDMHFARSQFTAVGLDDGRILAAGGALDPAGMPGTAELLICTKDDDCELSSYCAVDQTCKPRKANGQSCDPDALKDCKVEGCRFCQSNSCSDGVCCNKACDGQCEACDGSAVGAQVGKCAPVFGAPISNTFTKRDACITDESCGGECNGVRTDACTYPNKTPCGTRCSADTDTFESLGCDGKGACEFVLFSQPCGPYVCDEKEIQCTTGCTPATNEMPQVGCDDKTSVCNVDNQCVSAPTSCLGDNKMRETNGNEKSCGNFRCVGVACLNVCDTAYDCFLPPDATAEQTVVCDDSRQCVLVNKDNPGGDGSTTGCSTSPSHESSRFGWLAALAMAGAIAARRNRPRA